MLIRKTKSTCPICQKIIDANIMEKNDNVYMEKICSEHGRCDSLVWRNAQYYKTTNQLYFGVYGRPRPYKRFFLYFTNKCNLNCNICYLDCLHKKTEEMSLAEIEEALQRMGDVKCVLHGAEPTCRDDLFEIIRLINKYQKSVDMFTNGIKLTDKSYVQALKDAKIGMVYLQFDGFKRDAYKFLRGRDILDEKIKALKNLEEVGIPTVLIAVVAKGVNEDQMEKVISFAARSHFIKAVTFISFSMIGGAGAELLPNAFSVHECFKILEKDSAEKLGFGYLALCQKINYAYTFLSQVRICFFFHQFILFKGKNGYFTLLDIFDKKKLEGVFDRFALLAQKSRFLAFLNMVFSMTILIFSQPKSFKYCVNLAKMVLFGLCGFSNDKKENSPLLVTFHEGCDRYKLDFDVISHCDRILVYKENGSIQIDKSIGTYFFEKECEKVASNVTP